MQTQTEVVQVRVMDLSWLFVGGICLVVLLLLFAVLVVVALSVRRSDRGK